MTSGIAGPAPTSLLVFADDWGRHPSSSQHLVRCLLPHRNVDWVNTIGMRSPRLDVTTIVRGVQKVRQWARRRPMNGAELPAGLRVHNPQMWPWFRGRFDRRLNLSMLGRQLRSVISSRTALPIGITTLPITADLMGTLPVRRWVYYCVDDFSQWPGLDHRTLETMEREVVNRADVIIAASETLRARLSNWGRDSAILTHGVDLQHWSQPLAGSTPDVLQGFERPLVVFWGLIDRRIDIEFVRRTATALQRGTVVLIGPQQDEDPALRTIARVAHVPAQGYDILPAIAQAASVLIMPYADLPVTRAMQPLKLKEYLATGKPAVVSDLPAVRAWSDCLDIAGTAEEFAAAVQRRLESGPSEGQRVARSRLSAECWTAKARRFEQLIECHDADATNGQFGRDAESPQVAALQG